MKPFEVSESGKKYQRTVLLLAGWKTKAWMYHPVATLLASYGFRTLTYTYDDIVLSPDTSGTVKHLTGICDDILEKIRNLKKEGIRDINIFGTSLGTVIGLMAANRSPDVKRIILNSTGADFAATVWGWDSCKPKFKQALVEQKLTLQKLQNIWKCISPIKNIHSLTGKRILLYLSPGDEVIPYRFGDQLARALHTKRYDVTIVKTLPLRHWQACTYNLINARTYLRFLRS